MGDYALPVVKAIIATLKASSAISDAVGDQVYSDVPQNAEFPYIRVGISGEPFAADDFSGHEHTVRVQVFSRVASIDECLAIRAHVFTALDRNEEAITLEAGSLVKCEHSGVTDAFPEDNGKTWQSLIEFTVVTQ